MKLKKLNRERRVEKMQLKEKGITLIALVVTIVVLLILAGVTINALFGDTGIIKKAQDAQNKMDQAAENDLNALNELNEWLDDKINETTGENKTVDISTIIGKAVNKNTKAEDAYGNKITIPKGFKILPHGTEAGSADYTYSGDNIPAVQDGIVIEDTQEGTAGNQFVWVPVGIIKNKDNTTNTITLGRYSDFTMTNGEVASGQPVQVASVENCTQAVVINYHFEELVSSSRNTSAIDLTEFISTTLSNGGYYIARFEASGDTSKIESKYNQEVLIIARQTDAATAAREMYGEVKENNELIYASDLVNSYAWDTAIIFIQTYGTGEAASTYASQNKSTSFANTGINSDKYCNIWDMSGNAIEWTTEHSTYEYANAYFAYTCRGGYYLTDTSKTNYHTSYRFNDMMSLRNDAVSLRPLLYVK